MSYKSLNPPSHDSSGESDDSIQGSPLLNTSSRFAESPLQSPSNVRGEFDTGHPITLPNSVLSESDDDSSYSPSRVDSSVPHNPLGHNLRERRSQPHLRPFLETVDLEEEASNDNAGTSIVRGANVERSRIQRVDRRSLPPRLSSRTYKSPKDNHVLNFEGSAQRPNSMFIRKSFEPAKNSEANQQEEDEDDVLPFSATKQMAWSGRPKSMVQLSQSGGQIMSKETFDNYRKSISSLGMLKHMSSTGSFRSERSVGQKVNADGDVIDDLEVRSLESNGDSEIIEKEEHSHEQEKKRATAKLRKEQDARMSVYRQSMKKIVGGTSEPQLTLSHSTGNLAGDFTDADYEDEDSDSEDLMDDIPLSILQAHRFPKSRRKSPSSSSINRLSGSVASMSPKARTQSASPKLASTSRMSMLSQTSAPLDSGIQVASNGRGASYPELPSVFGNKNGGNTRGLINVIAEEEELRKRRHTFGYGTALPQSSSRTQLQAETSKAPPLVQPAKNDDLQIKLDQVLSLLSNLSPGQAGASPMGQNSPGMPPGSPWGYSNQMHQRAPSIHSAYSVRTNQTGTPYGGHHSAVPGEYIPEFPPQHFPSGVPQMHPNQSSFFTRQQAFMPAMPGQPPLPRGSQAFTRPASNRPSRMRVVEGEAEEEDDDAEWQKLMEKRKALRDQWKDTEEVSTT